MTRILLIILFMLSSCFSASAQKHKNEKGPLSKLLLEENPEYIFEYLNTQKIHSGDFLVHFFAYRYKEDKHTGGSGFEITSRKQNSPLWYKMIRGDFGPHSLKMLDLNKDTKPDLFYFSGFENEYSTHIYLAGYKNIPAKGYSKGNFVHVYSNNNDYSVLIDINQDKYPEILDSGYSGKTHSSGLGCSGNPSGIIIDKNYRAVLSPFVRQKIVAKYFEAAGRLDAYNFDYSMPDVYPVINSFILSPIKILHIEGHRTVDVTSLFPDYLRWRINILEQIKRESPAKCGDRITSVISYLQTRLNQ